jgi:outer membrane biosynthesis protein TonB
MFGGDEAGTVRSDAGDLFAAASGGSARGAAHHDDDDGGDLFGSKPARSAEPAGNPKLRGERNENSVLFSLNNLAQLASDRPAMSASSGGGGGGGGSAMSAPAGHATGAAGGEGSGLIDIRSMANAYLGGGGAAVKPTSAGIGSIDDLPVFGGGGFSEPAVLVPTAARSSNNKVLYVMIGAVGLLAVAAVIMVVMLLKSDKTAPQVAAADVKGDKTAGGDKALPPDKTPDTKTPDTKAPDKVEGSAAGSDTTATPPDKTATTPDKTATTPDKTATVPDKTHTSTTTTVHKDPKPPGTTTTTTTTTHKDPKPPKDTTTTTTTAKADKDNGSCDEVSCVLGNYEGACCAKYKKTKGGGGGGGGGDPGPSKPKSDLPDALDRSMISAGVGNVKARVTACGDKSSAKGKVKVHVKVGPDGHVSGSPSVEQSPDPALGACVANAMSKATFAKTQNGGSFSYPFVF